jgi:hypothetical protein
LRISELKPKKISAPSVQKNEDEAGDAVRRYLDFKGSFRNPKSLCF